MVVLLHAVVVAEVPTVVHAGRVGGIVVVAIGGAVVIVGDI